MKIAVTPARIIVGILFIFSGLVKANDPHGLSYKMQEYFEIWGIHQFNSWTLLLSVLMNAFEIIAGFALLLGWRIRLFSWLLLLMIVFFTFLTGYTYITGKPVNCGCFGDCLPISSKTSFLKDVALTVLIGFLFYNRNKIKPVFPAKSTTLAMLAVTVFSFGFQWYSLTYLPLVDCLPFKKGNNITEKMKMPADAVPDSTVITFVYEKGGKQIEFTADKFPADFNATDYKLVRRYDRIVKKGKNNEPPIKGFILTGPTNLDSTGVVLAQPYTVILFCEDFTVPVSKWKKDFEEIYRQASKKNIPVYMVTAKPDDAVSNVAGTAFAGVQIFKCDFKTILTAARTNPCLYLLKAGTVIDKWSYRRMKNVTAHLKELGVQEPPQLPQLVSPDSINQQPSTSNQLP